LARNRIGTGNMQHLEDVATIPVEDKTILREVRAIIARLVPAVTLYLYGSGARGCGLQKLRRCVSPNERTASASWSNDVRRYPTDAPCRSGERRLVTVFFMRRLVGLHQCGRHEKDGGIRRTGRAQQKPPSSEEPRGRFTLPLTSRQEG
jgi:hypothetical protein